MADMNEYIGQKEDLYNLCKENNLIDTVTLLNPEMDTDPTYLYGTKRTEYTLISPISPFLTERPTSCTSLCWSSITFFLMLIFSIFILWSVVNLLTCWLSAALSIVFFNPVYLLLLSTSFYRAFFSTTNDTQRHMIGTRNEGPHSKNGTIDGKF